MTSAPPKTAEGKPARRGFPFREICEERGFGTDLIERIVAHELKNPVELEFRPEGVRCVLTVPVRRPTEFSMRAGRTGAPQQAEPEPSK